MIAIPYYETSHFVFSNFSPHAIEIEGLIYPTVEHAYHAAKFTDRTIKSEIHRARSPLEANKLGKKYNDLRIKNWDEIKIDILYKLIVEKIMQHTEVKDTLLATNDEEIVEINPQDGFWGNGHEGNGQNHMGKILMRVREELKK